MSLKMLKSILHDVRQGAIPTTGEIAAAEREIEALEKAADALGVSGWLTRIARTGGISRGERKALAVLKAIAKEAK